MNIFYLKNIFYEHSKNEKLNYLQTVKIDSSTLKSPEFLVGNSFVL
jgi:poly-D-alanine transfer protein DltD